LEEDLSRAHLRLARTFIEHLSWQECVSKYDRPHTLFYCDPPYWGTEGYGVELGLEQYDEIGALARSIAGKMIISVNDISEMRSAFAGVTMESVDISYTVGGAQRCGERSGADHKELEISFIVEHPAEARTSAICVFPKTDS
jgi:DNA adenine methylase